MKRSILTLTSLLYCLSCFSQEMAGLHLGDVLTGRELSLSYSHGCIRKISVSAFIFTDLTPLFREESQEEKTHRLEFKNISQSEEMNKDKDPISGMITIDFWAEQCFTGPFISIGYRDSIFTQNCLLISIGNMIPIWEGVCFHLLYRKVLIGNHYCDNQLSFGLNYIF